MTTFTVKGMKEIHQFYFDNISHIMVEGPICTVYRIHGENVSFTKSLSYFEDVLQGHQFFRIHHNTIVNLKQIAKVKSRGNNHSVFLRDGTELNISVRKWKSFNQVFLDRYSKTIHSSN